MSPQTLCSSLKISLSLLLFAAIPLVLKAQGPDRRRPEVIRNGSVRAGARSDKQQLEEIEKNWAAAVGTNDPDRIGKFFTEDFLFVGAGGVLQNREQHLADFRTGVLRVKSVEVTRFDARIRDGFAVVTTLAKVEGTFKDRDISGEYRFMDSFQRTPAGWLALARQQTRVAGPPASGRPRSLEAVAQTRKAVADRTREASVNELKGQSADRALTDTTLPPPQRLALARDANTPFRNPPVVNAGERPYVLQVKYGENTIGKDKVLLRSYGGKLVGPTLRVKAGQALKVTLVNDLPNRDLGPHVLNGHHGWNLTNIHTHGLHVKPQANPGSPTPAPIESDNVLLEVKPGERQEYSFDIPADHPAGTFWYHAHKHGSTSAQVSSGMAGALIVTRDDAALNLDVIPAVKEAMATVGGREREKVMVFQQIPYIKETPGSVGTIELPNAGRMFGPNRWGRSDRYTTINGQQLPVIDFVPGEVQRWRMIDSGFREGLLLQLIKDPDGGGSGPDSIDFHEIAVDGLASHAVRRTSTLELFPGYRSDVLVQAPPQPGRYLLIDARREGNTLLGEDEPLKFVAKVVVTDAPAVTMGLPTDAQVLAQRMPSLPDPAPSTPVQHAYYGLNNGFVIGTEDPGPNGAVVGKQYDPRTARHLPLGAVQRWRIGTRNDFNFVGDPPPPPPRGPAHPFHIHVNPFEIVSIKDEHGVEQLGQGERVWRDTISMPPGYTIEFLTRYADFEGSFVQHCHILDHEDRGMMEKLTIGPPRVVPERKVAVPGRVTRAIPPAGGEPSVLFFVQGSSCPHCMSQLSAMAARLAERKLQVVVVSASSEADLAKFPEVPFALVADPESKLFKEYRAYDGKPRHATIVRDRAGKELLRKVGDEPFLDSGAILAALKRESPRYVIAVNGTDEVTDDYLTWAPTRCRIRMENGTRDGPDVEVTLTNDDPAASPEGGDVLFADRLDAGTTAARRTLTLRVKQDGTPTDFFLAGAKAGRLTEESLKQAGRDAVVHVREGGRVVGGIAVMVRVRKNYADLNPLERKEFLKALASLRDMQDVTKDRFEPLVHMHKLGAMERRQGFDQAHISSGFLPWHRAFLLLMEREFQKRYPHVALPYWRMDQPPVHFTPDDLGNNYDPLTHETPEEVILASTNPLYGWRIRFDNMGRLVRAPGDHVQVSNGAGYRASSALNGDSQGVYARFRPLLENNPHNDGHNNTGAWMQSCVTSPGDPLFWIFHCHHDHLWAQWQREFDRFETGGTDPAHYFPERKYSSDAPLNQRIRFPLGHHLKDKMWPWDETKGRQNPDDPHTTRPDAKLAKFPQAPSAGLWPPAEASPTCADMIDYQGLASGRLPHGFTYDDTPFGPASPRSPRPFRGGERMERPSVNLFLDGGASEANRLSAARDLSALDFEGRSGALATVLKDKSTSAAVKAQALKLLARAAPAEGAARAAELARGVDAALAAAAVRELVRMHHLGELSDGTRGDVGMALQELAKGAGSPAAQAVALEALAGDGDRGVSPLLKDLLAAPLKSSLPLRRLVALSRLYPEHHGLVRPMLAVKQRDLVVAALWALEGDKDTLDQRLRMVTAKEADPAVRRAAMRGVMAESPRALGVLVSVATDSGEGDEVRAEAAAAVRVAVQSHRRALGDAVGKADAALAALRLPPTSTLAKTVELTLETIREEKR